MKRIGNTKFNEIYEFSLTEGKISAGADRYVFDFNFLLVLNSHLFFFGRTSREKFIRLKYESKAFCEPSSSSPDALAYELFNRISDPNYDATMDIIRYVAQGINLQWQNPDDQMKTILHQAVIHEKIASIELLIQNNISIFSTDAHTRTPMVCFFIFPQQQT